MKKIPAFPIPKECLVERFEMLGNSKKWMALDASLNGLASALWCDVSEDYMYFYEYYTTTCKDIQDMLLHIELVEQSHEHGKVTRRVTDQYIVNTINLSSLQLIMSGGHYISEPLFLTGFFMESEDVQKVYQRVIDGKIKIHENLHELRKQLQEFGKSVDLPPLPTIVGGQEGVVQSTKKNSDYFSIEYRPNEVSHYPLVQCFVWLVLEKMYRKP